jgi:protein SCO1/2
MSKRRLIVIAAIATIGLVCLAAFAWLWRTTSAASNDFVLQSASGPFDTASLRGKVVLVYFGYTFCPDICPTSLITTASAFRSLRADELAQVRLVFVSVDPERDTPTQLRDYVGFFHPNMIGVTGSPEEIATLAKHYGVIYARHNTGGADGGYTVDHSAWIYILAPDGRLVERLPHGTAVDQIVTAIRKQLLPTSSTKGTS